MVLGIKQVEDIIRVSQYGYTIFESWHKETNNGEDFKQYYIANIIKVVDALCLDKSEYFETEIEGIGTIYTVSKYGIYADKTDSADVFKLSNRQEIPIFVSEKFKDLIQKVNITGISLTEISVV